MPEALPEANWAVIGGSGVYDLELLDQVSTHTVQTPYGDVTFRHGKLHGEPVFFLARHGEDHSLPPHRVNYRANIYALAELGVKRVIATNAVGSLRERMMPGHFVLPDQFLDFTRARPATFFDRGDRVVHVDVTEPYCPVLRRQLAEVARPLGLIVHEGATYVCTEGPRYETPAEIRMFAAMGGDLVGMTSVPEVVLAREAGLCYASVCLVTNYAAGIAGHPVSHEDILDVTRRQLESLQSLIMETIPRAGVDSDCVCRRHGALLPLKR